MDEHDARFGVCVCEFLIRPSCVQIRLCTASRPSAIRLLPSDIEDPSQSFTIIVGELCGGETFGLRPPSAERFEDRCRLTCDLDSALRQSVFGIQTHALRVEHRQEVVGAELKSLPGEIGGGARRPSRQIQMTKRSRSCT